MLTFFIDKHTVNWADVVRVYETASPGTFAICVVGDKERVYIDKNQYEVLRNALRNWRGEFMVIEL